MGAGFQDIQKGYDWNVQMWQTRQVWCNCGSQVAVGYKPCNKSKLYLISHTVSKIYFQVFFYC